jgi:hypothetical protein
MSPKKLRLRFWPNFLKPSKTKTRRTFGLTIMLFVTAFSFAQQSSTNSQSSPDGNSQVAVSKSSASIAIPGGTRFALVLTQPIQTRYIHHGDDIYAQIVSPVTAGNETVIPPGTFVQGKVDKIERQGGRGEIRLQSMSMTFPDGYTIPVAGPVTLTSPDGYAVKDPGPRRGLAAIALPAGGAGVGALIGHFASSSQSTTITNTSPPFCGVPTPGCMYPTSQSLTIPGSSAKGTIIGATVGGAVGAAASIAILVNSHNFFIDAGSPVEMVLQHELILPQDEVADAVQRSEEHPVPEQPIAQRPRYWPPPDSDPGVCYTPGNPGTPDTDIPGTPATGDSPGTPSIHIPGIPPTPPTAHPCP